MQHDPLAQRISQGIHYVENSYHLQDAEAIERLRRSQEQQTFTFVSNNMNTAVHFDYMGLYVVGTISEVPTVKE